MTVNESNETRPEQWVPEAIAEQEEHLRRSRPCMEVYFQDHTWVEMTGPHGRHFEACGVCDVSKSPRDGDIREGVAPW